jgi:hypothetical protein
MPGLQSRGQGQKPALNMSGPRGERAGHVHWEEAVVRCVCDLCRMSKYRQQDEADLKGRSENS